MQTDLKSLLYDYNPYDKTEKYNKEKMLQLLNYEPICFSRELLTGHFTASAFIINSQKTKTVLVKHAKLNRWVQPGGHCDGDSNLFNVALKEANEETGLLKLHLISNSIFDLDIHTIPMRKEVQSHLHYDVRFLLIADESEPFVISDESTDIKWVMISNIADFNVDESILRMARKILIS